MAERQRAQDLQVVDTHLFHIQVGNYYFHLFSIFMQLFFKQINSNILLFIYRKFQSTIIINFLITQYSEQAGGGKTESAVQAVEASRNRRLFDQAVQDWNECGKSGAKSVKSQSQGGLWEG